MRNEQPKNKVLLDKLKTIYRENLAQNFVFGKIDKY